MISTEQVLKRDYNEENLGISRESVLQAIQAESAASDSLATIDAYLSDGSLIQLRRALETVRGMEIADNLRLVGVRLALNVIRSTPQSGRVAFPIIRQTILHNAGFVAALGALEQARISN